MRTPIYVLIAALVFSGCTHYHATPASSTSRPVDRIEEPEPEPVEALELEVGRPNGGQLLLQTNRPAYVAIFEIIPNRGVTLIYPAAAHQQNMMVSGLTWVPLWWSPKRVTFSSDRYVYAVASEEPLQLSGETFEGGYFHRVLGAGIYRAEHPYSTMRAISRAIVPDVAAEAWAEDVRVVTPTYLTETFRTARIHCPGGKVFDVPEDMIARIWCPTRTRVVIIDVSRPRSRDYPVGRPVRPDSVYGRGRWKLEPRRPRGPIARVVDPTGRDRDDRDHRRARDDRNDRDDDRGRRRDGRDERADRNDRDDPNNRDDRNDRDEKPEKKRRGRIIDLIKDVKEEEHDREKQDRERQRREADEARRREADERRTERDERKDERDERKDERKEERDERKDNRDERKDDRKDERDARKEERDERKDERKDEAKQQGQPRDDKRDEPRDDNRRRGSIKDMIKEQKEKKDKEKKDKQDKDQS